MGGPNIWTSIVCQSNLNPQLKNEGNTTVKGNTVELSMGCQNLSQLFSCIFACAWCKTNRLHRAICSKKNSFGPCKSCHNYCQVPLNPLHSISWAQFGGWSKHDNEEPVRYKRAGALTLASFERWRPIVRYRNCTPRKCCMRNMQFERMSVSGPGRFFFPHEKDREWAMKVEGLMRHHTDSHLLPRWAQS